MTNNTNNLIKKIFILLGLFLVVLGSFVVHKRVEAADETRPTPYSFYLAAYRQAIDKGATNDEAVIAGNKAMNAAKANGTAGDYSYTDPKGGVTNDPCGMVTGHWLNCATAKIGNIVLSLSSYALYIAGWSFNKSVTYSLDMATIIAPGGDLPIVNTGWVILRDITNMGYIFLLLFISISIILGNSKYGSKELIAQVIITAMLVNFSLFATKLVVDGTNIVALQFYNELIKPAGTSGDAAAGITDQFMSALNMTSIYGSGADIAKSNDPNANAAQAALALSNKTDTVDNKFFKIIQVTFMGTIFVLATAVVFFAGAFMFLTRTLVLMFVMMGSAAAFAARILPATRKYFDDWLSHLINQSIFAPVFISLVYILITAMKTVSPTGSNSKINFASMILNGSFTQGFVYFALILGALLGILIISKKLGIYGAGAFHKFLDEKVGHGNWFGTKKILTSSAVRVGGGTATALADTKIAKAFGRMPVLGGTISKGLRNVSKATGYDALMKKNKADEEANYKYQTGTSDRRRAWENDDDYKTRMAKTKKDGAERGYAYAGIKTDEDGNITGLNKWGKLASLVGGKATDDFQRGIVKKHKKEKEKKERGMADALSNIEGVKNLTGVDELIEGSGKDTSINEKMALKMLTAVNSEAIDIVKDSDGNEVMVKIGDIPVTSDSIIGKALGNVANSTTTEGRRSARVDLQQKIGQLKTKLKAHNDHLRREQEREDREEKESANKREEKPKEPKKGEDKK